MNPRAITPSLFVGGQITAADVEALARRGIRSILCNRPDGEEPGQPDFAEIAAAARAAGVEVRHLPIIGAPSDEAAAAFGEALERLPAPVLAYCRAGQRSATAWALSQARVRSVADILAATGAAGYDIGAVVPRIAEAGRVPAGRLHAAQSA
jgi:sulfide:quinone oxidoreductase